MWKDIQKYVGFCDICQKIKVSYHCPYGSLASLSVSDELWQEIMMNFIVGLLSSKHKGNVYDFILVMVD